MNRARLCGSGAALGSAWWNDAPVRLGLLTLATLVSSPAGAADAPEKTPVPVRLVFLDWERAPAQVVIEHLRADLPTLEVTTSSRALSAEDLVSGPPRREAVILLELHAARITAIRTDQRTVITRAFAPNTGRDAPYSFAVATLELIDIAAERRPAPAPSLPSTPAAWSFGVGVGPSFTAGLGSDPSLVQLALGLDVLFRAQGRGTWWSVGPRARLLGGADRSSVIGPERFELTYQRQDLALRSALGLSFGRVDLGIAVSGGLSLASLEVASASLPAAAPETTAEGFLGPGLEARYALGAGLGLTLTVDGLLTFEPVQYLVRDEVVLEDGRLRTVVSLALGWQSDFGE